MILLGCSNSDVISFRSGEMTHEFIRNQALIKKKLPFELYPQAKITGFVENEDNQSASYLIATTNDDISKVENFYLDSLKQNQWTIESNSDIDGIVSISCHKNVTDANIMISKSNSKTNINISFTNNQSPKSPSNNDDINNPLDSTD